MVGPTTYFMFLSLSKLHIPFIIINGEDTYPLTNALSALCKDSKEGVKIISIC